MSAVRFQVRPFALALAGLAAAGIAAPAAAQDFYAGKTIELLIGAQAGGGYDIYGRVVARHIGRHIPGNPNIVPKNMEGAGSARAAGFIAKVAPKDGTVIANIMPGAVIGPLLDPKVEKLFDPTQVMYIGNVNNGVRVCVSGKNSKVKTFDDARKIKATFGGGPFNDSTRDYGYLHKNTTGAQWDMVTGYKGTVDLVLAVERGEVEGFCGFDWASLKSQRPGWLRDKEVNVLIQDAIEPLDELTRLGVPHIMKYVADDTDAQSRGADPQPAGVPPLLHRTAGDHAGESRHPAQGVRRHHEGPAIRCRCGQASHRRRAAVGRAGSGGRAQSLRIAAGRRGARARRNQMTCR